MLESFGGCVEYNYEIELNVAMLYTWTATGVVNFTSHTKSAAGPPGALDSFERGTAHGQRGSRLRCCPLRRHL